MAIGVIKFWTTPIPTPHEPGFRVSRDGNISFSQTTSHLNLLLKVSNISQCTVLSIFIAFFNYFFLSFVHVGTMVNKAFWSLIWRM